MRTMIWSPAIFLGVLLQHPATEAQGTPKKPVAAASQPGPTFRDCAEMVALPAGSFYFQIIGCDGSRGAPTPFWRVGILDSREAMRLDSQNPVFLFRLF